MKPTLKYWSSLIFFTGFFLMFLMSCEQPGSRVSDIASEEEKIQQEVQFEPEQLSLIISYHLDSITTSEAVDSFQNRFSEDAQKIIFSLNRIDPERLEPGTVMIIPDTISSDLMDYSPFPETFEMLEKIPKTVLISRRVQAFGLYEEGKLIKWGPVSSGKRSTPTPAGLFYGNHKARRKVSTVNDAWILPYYFNFMNFEGVGVHQYSMPGYPASHACVRLYMEDAVQIYNWASQWKLNESGREILKNGTPFMVFGDYDFEKPAPWLSLAENHNSNYLNAEEMDTLKKYVEQYFRDPKNLELPPSSEEKLAIPPKEGLETIK